MTTNYDGNDSDDFMQNKEKINKTDFNFYNTSIPTEARELIIQDGIFMSG